MSELRIVKFSEMTLIKLGLRNDKLYFKDEADKAIAYQKYKRCLAMAEWCEATALWCYQAANTLPAGFHATLYGKRVMIEPDRLFKRWALLTKWHKRWLKLAEKFSKGETDADGISVDTDSIGRKNNV